jgi:hypothetical protein
MGSIEKQVISKIAKAKSLSISELGLRFDRVVIRLVHELHLFASKTVPAGATVLVTVSAPIRLPAKTLDALKKRIESLLASESIRKDHKAMIQGSRVQMRIIKHSARRKQKLLAFVQNRDSNSALLLDLVEE